MKNQLFCNNKSNTYRNRKIKTDSLYCRCVGKGVEENERPNQQNNEFFRVYRYTSGVVHIFQVRWKRNSNILLKTEFVKITYRGLKQLHPWLREISSSHGVFNLCLVEKV